MLLKNCGLPDGSRDIRTEGDRIVAVSPALTPLAGEQVLDAAGGMTVVGLADCHLHLDKCQLHTRADYQDVIAPEKGRLTRDQKSLLSEADVYSNAKGVIEMAIRAGSIAMRTNCDIDPMIELRAVRALMRLREEYKGRLQLQVVPFVQEGLFKHDGVEALLRQALEMGADGVGGHTLMDTDGKKHIDTILALAAEYKISADFHVDESGNPDHFLMPYLTEQVVARGLQGRVNYIHACSLTAVADDVAAREIAAAKAAGISVIVAPTAISTRKLTRVKEWVAAGVPVVLGSDNIGDFFNPFGSANPLHVTYLLSMAHRFFTPEERAQLLDMVTVQPGHIFGRSFGGAALTVGAPADITVLRGADPREVLSRLEHPLYRVRGGVLVE